VGKREFCTFAVAVVKPPPSPSRRDVIGKRDSAVFGRKFGENLKSSKKAINLEMN